MDIAYIEGYNKGVWNINIAILGLDIYVYVKGIVIFECERNQSLLTLSCAFASAQASSVLGQYDQLEA